MLKMASERFIHALLLFSNFLLGAPVHCPVTSGFASAPGGWGGGGYSGFQLKGIEKNNSLFKHGKIHQEYKKS